MCKNDSGQKIAHLILVNILDIMNFKRLVSFRIGFKNDYKTMDPNFMESVWWVFKTMFDKGLVYRGYKVMPYSTFRGTLYSW